MARQRIGAFNRIRKRRDEVLAKKKEKAEQVVVEEPVIVPEVDPVELFKALEEAEAAEKRYQDAVKSKKLVRSGRAAELKKEAENKREVAKKITEPAPPVPTKVLTPATSDLQVALTLFDWSLIVLLVGAEIVKVNKWWAAGGAVSLAILYYVAERQGWLDFLSL